MFTMEDAIRIAEKLDVDFSKEAFLILWYNIINKNW